LFIVYLLDGNYLLLWSIAVSIMHCLFADKKATSIKLFVVL